MYSYGPPHMAEQKQDDQLEHTYSSYVRIRDVALKTCQRRWTIGRSGEIGSVISVLVAWHDDDDICSRKNFIFLFGALINLTVRVDTYFHQIRVTYPIQPGPFFRAVINWGKAAKHSLFLWTFLKRTDVVTVLSLH